MKKGVKKQIRFWEWCLKNSGFWLLFILGILDTIYLEKYLSPSFTVTPEIKILKIIFGILFLILLFYIYYGIVVNKGKLRKIIGLDDYGNFVDSKKRNFLFKLSLILSLNIIISFYLLLISALFLYIPNGLFYKILIFNMVISIMILIIIFPVGLYLKLNKKSKKLE